MPYIGTGLVGNFASTFRDEFTGDGSNTNFTLSRNAHHENDLEVFVGNVRQQPGDAYTVSGTTLAFTGTPANGEVIYVVHQAGALQTVQAPTDHGARDFNITGDANKITFGDDSEITMTHVADSGLALKNTNTGDDKPFTLVLQTGETDIAANDKLGVINFQAPDEGTGTDAILVAAGIEAVSEGDFSSSSNATKLSFKTASSAAAAETMSLSSGGNLTVSGNVSVGGDLDVTGSFDMSDANITNVGSIALDSISGDADSNTSITFSGSDVITFATGGSTAFTANADQSVTFSAAVSGTSADFDGGVTIDNITIDGTEIDLSSGDFTLDVAGNIFLDADGGDIRLVDAGTQFGVLQNNSSDFVIQSSVSDKDVLLKGNDGGSGITALTLDMSDAGKALFNAGATFASLVSITTADNSPQLRLISTDADENVGPEIDLYRNSSSPADGDILGRLVFHGENDNDEKIDYANIQFRIADASDGTEDARLLIVKKVAGADVGVMSSNDTETVFNDDSIDLDFRVEGNGDANAIFLQGSSDRVGIGTSTPGSKLTVSEGGNSGGLLRLDETDAANLAGYMQFDSNGTNKANIQNANNAGIHINVGTGGSVVFTQTGYTAANALDDYEEGTWTPALSSTSASFSYGTQSGEYIKIGRVVYVSFRLSLSGSPSGTTSNTTFLTGLPITIDSTAHYAASHAGHYFNLNKTDTDEEPVYQQQPGDTKFEIKMVGDLQGESNLTPAQMQSNFELRSAVVYLAGS